MNNQYRKRFQSAAIILIISITAWHDFAWWLYGPRKYYAAVSPYTADRSLQCGSVPRLPTHYCNRRCRYDYFLIIIFYSGRYFIIVNGATIPKLR